MSRLREIRSWREAVPLTRPYAIAGRRIDAVEIFFVELRDETGRIGHGSAAPAEPVTGESPEACAEALADGGLDWLLGEDPRRIGRLTRIAADELATTPAARAAVDMALWDLHASILDIPLVDCFGRRRRQPLPTSITVGIQGADEALREADEYLRRGFRCLKIKIGDAWERDVDLLERLRAHLGPGVAIRVDANQGYGAEELRRLLDLARRLDLELVEQPLPRRVEMRPPADQVPLLAADESLHNATDAAQLLRSGEFGIANIKLMKCGGPTGALAIASIAKAGGLDLMWGCMDESVVSIAAALHAAYASPRTRFLDLDGSFDLARDPAVGGFRLEDGRLHLLDAPGLGVRWR